MGMYISIGKDTGWGTSGGIFNCIVEGTRGLFKDSEQMCVKEIYTALDEEGQSFIVLDDVGVECYNLFYNYCKEAMEKSPNSERGQAIPKERIDGILWNWSEVLRIMREDPRYRGQQEIS